MGVVASILISRLGGTEVKGVTSAFAASSVLVYTAVNLDLAQQTLRQARLTDTLDEIRGRLTRLWPWYAVPAAVAVVVGLVTESPGVTWLAAGAFAYLISTHLGLACTGLSGPSVTAAGGIIQQAGLAVACLLAAAINHLDTDWAPLIVIVSFLAPMPLYYWAARARGPRHAGPRTRIRSRALIAAGLRWQGARLFQLLLLRLDILWVFWFLGASSAGIYAVGLATATLAGLVPAQFASNTTYEAMRGRSLSLRRNAVAAGLAGLACAAVLAAAGWPLLTLAYGPAFSGSYAVMLAALPGVVAYGVLQVYTNQIRIVGKAGAVAVPSAIGAVAMTAILVAAVPAWDVLAAALASSVGSVAALAAAYVLARRSRRLASAADVQETSAP